MEYVPKEFEISHLRVEYKNSAMYHDVMVPVVTKTKDTIVVVLQDEQGKIFAVVEFERGKEC